MEEKHGEAIVKPINALAFNRKYNTAMTCGGDGVVKTWNIEKKSAYFTSKTFPLPIQTGDFQDSGDLLAYVV